MASMASQTNFNPRPREGGDRTNFTMEDKYIHFNPRPREGGDQMLRNAGVPVMISIHAPVKGATRK